MDPQSPDSMIASDGDTAQTLDGCAASLRMALEQSDPKAIASAWVDFVCTSFRERDFSRLHLLCDGEKVMRREFDRIPAAFHAHVAVAGFALAPLIGADPAAVAFWEDGAFEHAAREDDDEVWLALGIASCGAGLWLGRSIDRLRGALPRIELSAQRHASAARGWHAAYGAFRSIYPDPERGPHASTPAAEPMHVEIGDPSTVAVCMIDHLASDRLDAARALVQRRLQTSVRPGSYDEWLLSFYQTWLHTKANDLQLAQQDAARAAALSIRLGLPHVLAWSAYASARTLPDTAPAATCRRQLAMARSAARRAGNELLLHLCRLAAALRALRRERRLAALRLARPGLLYLQRQGMLRPPLLDTAEIEGLASIRDSGNDPTGTIMPATADPAPESSRGSAPRAVEIHCLGRFSVRREGVPLHWSRKPPRKPLTLLKLLVACGPEGALVNHIADSLWPALDADRARKAMSTALYRLRSMLGEQAILLESGRMRIDARTVWVDLHAFETAARSRDSAQEALALYTGGFLADEDEGWVVSARHRASELYRELVRARGEQLLVTGGWRAALALFHEGLAHDPLAEVFYQGALSACRAGGLRAEASAIYQRCRSELTAQLGLSPSDRTLAIYAEAIRS